MFSVRQNPQRGPGRLTNSAARTEVVLLIRRTVRPRGYASGFVSPAAALDDLFEQPAVRHIVSSASTLGMRCGILVASSAEICRIYHLEFVRNPVSQITIQKVSGVDPSF